MSEIWKDIPDYEGMYQVSNLGNVKSLKWNKERILKATISSRGYKMVHITNNFKSKGFSVHQLVAMAFINHTPCGHKLVIDHINENKIDNRLENLQIITNRYNISKSYKNKSSKYTGVCFDKNRNKWISTIKINGKQKNLGRFKTEEEAHKIYQLKLKTI